MAKTDANQHEVGVTVRESTHLAGAATDFQTEPINHIVGADTGPALTDYAALNTIFSEIALFEQI